MVPRHSQGGKKLAPLGALRRPGGGVVHPDIGALQPPLEGIGILPDVVGQPGQPPLLPGAKGGGKTGATPGGAVQMLQYRLFPLIISDVGQICRSHPVPSLDFGKFCHTLPLL